MRRRPRSRVVTVRAAPPPRDRRPRRRPRVDRRGGRVKRVEREGGRDQSWKADHTHRSIGGRLIIGIVVGEAAARERLRLGAYDQRRPKESWGQPQKGDARLPAGASRGHRVVSRDPGPMCAARRRLSREPSRGPDPTLASQLQIIQSDVDGPPSNAAARRTETLSGRASRANSSLKLAPSDRVTRSSGAAVDEARPAVLPGQYDARDIRPHLRNGFRVRCSIRTKRVWTVNAIVSPATLH